jgi:hypothetical protein
MIPGQRRDLDPWPGGPVRFEHWPKALVGAVRAGGLPQAPTIDAFLPALLGRLLPEWAGDARRVLEAAAVLGRRFDCTLLPAVTRLDETVVGRSARLGRRSAPRRRGRVPLPPRIYLSPRTVEEHVGSLLVKLGAKNRTQLVALTSSLGG